MAGLINIGLTGLLSHQSALSTTGNNVANANTPGYSRQQAIFETLPSQLIGGAYQGTGVTIEDIRRLNSEFLNQQLRSDTTLNGEQSVLAAELGRLDNLFASENTGLNRALTDFFAAVQDAAESPDSIPQRQLVISRGEALAQRFNSLSTKLDQHQASIDQQLGNETAAINSLAQSIAQLNQAISSAPGLSQGIQPNELLDQRDEKLRQLADLVSIQVAPQGNGQVDVYIGKGQSLVSGDTANALSVRASDPGEVFLTVGTSERAVTGALNGGRLGGLLAFRQDGLETARSTLDDIATSLIEEVNAQHRRGIDLSGLQGGEFFTGTGADDIAMVLSAPLSVALASPLAAETADANRGSGTITQGTVLDIDGPGFGPGGIPEDVLIRFTSATDYDVVLAGPPETSLFSQTYSPGEGVFPTDPADPNYRGYQFTLSGAPQTGDTFSIGLNENTYGDNRNAIALGDIAGQSIVTVNGSDMSLDSAYGLLVTEVGAETSRAQRGLEASTTLLEQSNTNWQEQSGVNLDEEAGKLIQFQAAYNASAQVVSVARELFDTLLSSFR